MRGVWVCLNISAASMITIKEGLVKLTSVEDFVDFFLSCDGLSQLGLYIT